MRKVILTIGICVAGLMGVQAQQPMPAKAPAAKSTAAPKEQQVEKMVTNMTSACHLTPDQVTKAKPIVSEFVSARMANKEKFGSDKDKLKAANQASMKDMTTKLGTVLNPAQQKQWADYVKQKMAEKDKKQSAK